MTEKTAIESLPKKEEALAAAYMDKQSDEFGRFFLRCEPYIRKRCQLLGLQESDANDITQRIFINFTKHFNYHGKSEFRTWMYTVVNRAVNEYRQLLGNKRLKTNIDISEDRPDNVPGPLDQLIEAEAPQRVTKLLNADHDPIARKLMFKHYCEGKTIDEAAKEIGVKRGTAASKVHRATARLKLLLNSSGDKSLG
jgi:RNA polymerase sigma factor (sigma-70 family)